MSYIEESLSTGEKVEALFRLHWVAWLPTAAWLVLGLVSFGLTWLIALYTWLRLRFLEQGVTNKRVILKTGIIGRHTEEMKLSSIETVEIRQGIWGRMLGFGTVQITGRGISDIAFRYLDDPLAAKRQIESVSMPMDAAGDA